VRGRAQPGSVRGGPAHHRIDFLIVRGRRSQAEAHLRRYSVDASIVAAPPPSGAGSAGSWRFLFGPGYPRRTLLFWATNFMSLLILYGVYTWLPVLLTRAGYDLGSAIALLLTLNLNMAAGAITSSWLADRLGRRRVIFTAFLCAAAGFILLTQEPPLLGAYVLVVIIGAGALGTQILVNAFVAASYPITHRATALGAALGVGRPLVRRAPGEATALARLRIGVVPPEDIDDTAVGQHVLRWPGCPGELARREPPPAGQVRGLATGKEPRDPKMAVGQETHRLQRLPPVAVLAVLRIDGATDLVGAIRPAVDADRRQQLPRARVGAEERDERITDHERVAAG
jgi:hypothetical protein